MNEPKFVGRIPSREDLQIEPETPLELLHRQEKASIIRAIESQGMSVYQKSQEFFSRQGQTYIDCLASLKGQPWDDRAKGLVQALRPTGVAVIKYRQMVHLICPQHWTVEVHLAEDGNIAGIRQWVLVGLPDNFANGHEMSSNRPGLMKELDPNGTGVIAIGFKDKP